MPKGPRGEKRAADVIGAAVVVAEALQETRTPIRRPVPYLWASRCCLLG